MNRAGVPCILAAFALAAAAARTGEAASTIVSLPIATDEHQSQPLAIPTESSMTTEVDFPWPLADWAGRGFTPNPEAFAGDFVIAATRGSRRLFITPTAGGTRRILHVVLSRTPSDERGVTIAFLPAPSGLGWAKVVLASAEEEAPRRAELSASPPPPRLRVASPESELGLLQTMRLAAAVPVPEAEALIASNPALRLARLPDEPEPYGGYTVTMRFAVRDATTGTLAVCASILNTGPTRLLFDATGWVLRAGDRVYPVRTLDFPGVLDSGSSAPLFLVLARGPDGLPTRLLPENTFRLSGVILASVNPRPVVRLSL